jgi:hypothetical protein
MVLGTGFSMAFVLAMLLHAILPEEKEPPSLRAAASRNAEHYESGGGGAGAPAAGHTDAISAIPSSDDLGATGASPGGGINAGGGGGGYHDGYDGSKGKGKDISKGDGLKAGSTKGADLFLAVVPDTAMGYGECGRGAQCSDAGSSDSASASAAVIIITDVESQVAEVTAAPAK